METLIKTKKTHIARVRDLDMSIMQEVCEILGISDQRYCEIQYSNYEQFASLVTKNSTNKIRYSGIYRGFFNNEWAQRNKDYVAFIDRFSILPGSTQAAAIYANLHDPKTLHKDPSFTARFSEVLKMISRLGGERC